MLQKTAVNKNCTEMRQDRGYHLLIKYDSL